MKLYVMSFADAATAAAAVAANPAAYVNGTFIWAETEKTMHLVIDGAVSNALALVV
jgi:hypothetical protein